MTVRPRPKGCAPESAYLSRMTQQTFRLPATVDRPSLFIRRQPAGGAPVLYRHHDCGEISHGELRCSHCRRPMGVNDIDVLPGPGGRRHPATVRQGKR